GYFHIDIAEVRTEEGKLHLFVAIDRTSKFAFATATAFLKALIAVVPYKIHTILTDNGIQFCDLPKNRSGPTARWQTHMFDLLCRAHGKWTGTRDSRDAASPVLSEAFFRP